MSSRFPALAATALAVAAFAASAFALAAPLQAEGTGAFAKRETGAATEPRKHRLNFSWPVNAGPLNPHLYAPNQMYAQAMVYEPLVKYVAGGNIIPWLAQSWDVSDDRKVYTFHLRPGVTFSNGEPFNADAVVANIRAVLDNRAHHAWLELANQISSATATDPLTVQLTLKDPYYPVLQELALPRPFRFVAPSQFRDGGTKHGIVAPVGTGPWKLAQTRIGERDLFTRNDAYWGEKPAYEEIDVKVVPDPNTRAIAFETGDIDLIYGSEGAIFPDTFERFRAMKTVATGLSRPMETSVLAMNSRQGPTADIAVRKAINHSIDKDTMIARMLHGTQQRADMLFAPGTPYTDINLAPYAYDPARAVKLLDDAGWKLAKGARVRSRDGVPLELELCFVGNDALSKSMAEVIQADLAKIGVSIRLAGEEESSISARQLDGRFGIVFSRTWGPPYDPHAFLGSMRAPSHADYQAQRGLPDKAEIDGLISKVLVTTNETERRRLYRDILTRLHDSAVYVPLAHVTSIAVARPKLGPIPFGAIVSDIPFDRIGKQ